MDCCRCIAAGRGLSLLISACRGLLFLLLAGARGVLLDILLQAAVAEFLSRWVAVGLSCSHLSLRALHVCETGGVECLAECGLWVVLSGIVARNESTMYTRTTISMG